MTRHSLRPTQSQRGISLIVVMVMLLLGTILVLSASRTNWLNESLVGNESDYQRAYTAAEALIGDAETDIRGTLLGGALCRTDAGFDGCRDRGNSLPFFPSTKTYDLDDAVANLAGAQCRNGICISDPATDLALGANWWNDAARVTAMTAAGVPANYGQYTRANLSDSTGQTGNPLLRQRADGNFAAWYWVEVLPYNTDSAVGVPVAGVPIPADSQPFVYRITAMVNGLKPGTRVVLRSLFVPNVSTGS
ncbi:PilX N-terminal domain-containing pilus assembly protein [Hydrogenophaga sp. PAMC20947]|uniref:pilus assembly PilX family protein n=1 Tax=Hydrogenophaga sp. PAMC20947 TaxID=2565558 RepID=UPI00109E2A10|nr:PilX N-terminal domain-containing pilus assembly protein [Hydrogenophaga sp. PAMC20947]QCB45037.1 pilus assembly protein [Hydrogenophaga sp. PAMC20947]